MLSVRLFFRIERALQYKTVIYGAYKNFAVIEIIKLKGSETLRRTLEVLFMVLGSKTRKMCRTLRQFAVHFLINDFGRFKCEAGDRMCHSSDLVSIETKLY